MTAVSDLEVVQKETVGKMYYYKYPIKGEEGEFVHIATTGRKPCSAIPRLPFPKTMKS